MFPKLLGELTYFDAAQREVHSFVGILQIDIFIFISRYSSQAVLLGSYYEDTLAGTR